MGSDGTDKFWVPITRSGDDGSYGRRVTGMRGRRASGPVRLDGVQNV